MDLQKTTKEQMEYILSSSKSMREVILKFNLSPNGSGGYRNVKKRITDLGIDIPKYNYHGDGVNRRKLKDCEIYTKHSTYSRQSLKRRIIKDNLLEYKCTECGNNGQHNGKLLSLHLDHINGINDDNRLDNLRFLCPNCHSQTETYSGKSNKKLHLCECGNKKDKNSNECRECSSFKRRKVERPDVDTLIMEVKNTGYSATGRKYGVSDNTIRKWIKNTG